MDNKTTDVNEELVFKFCSKIPEHILHYLKAFGIEVLPTGRKRTWKSLSSGDIIREVHVGGLFHNGEELTVKNPRYGIYSVDVKDGDDVYELLLRITPEYEEITYSKVINNYYMHTDTPIVFIRTKVDKKCITMSFGIDSLMPYKSENYREISIMLGIYDSVVISVKDAVNKFVKKSSGEPAYRETYRIMPNQEHGFAQEIINSVATKFSRPDNPIEAKGLDAMLHDPRLVEMLDKLLELMKDFSNIDDIETKRELIKKEYKDKLDAKLSEFDREISEKKRRMDVSREYKYGLILESEIGSVGKRK